MFDCHLVDCLRLELRAETALPARASENSREKTRRATTDREGEARAEDYALRPQMREVVSPRLWMEMIFRPEKGAVVAAPLFYPKKNRPPSPKSRRAQARKEKALDDESKGACPESCGLEW